jgi:hypothetical protein
MGGRRSRPVQSSGEADQGEAVAGALAVSRDSAAWRLSWNPRPRQKREVALGLRFTGQAPPRKPLAGRARQAADGAFGPLFGEGWKRL